MTGGGEETADQGDDGRILLPPALVTGFQAKDDAARSQKGLRLQENTIRFREVVDDTCEGDDIELALDIIQGLDFVPQGTEAVVSRAGSKSFAGGGDGL